MVGQNNKSLHVSVFPEKQIEGNPETYQLVIYDGKNLNSRFLIAQGLNLYMEKKYHSRLMQVLSDCGMNFNGKPVNDETLIVYQSGTGPSADVDKRTFELTSRVNYP